MDPRRDISENGCPVIVHVVISANTIFPLCWTQY